MHMDSINLSYPGGGLSIYDPSNSVWNNNWVGWLQLNLSLERACESLLSIKVISPKDPGCFVDKKDNTGRVVLDISYIFGHIIIESKIPIMVYFTARYQ